MNVSQSKVNYSLIVSPEGSVPRLNLQPFILKRSSKLGHHRFSADQSSLNHIIRPQFGINSQQATIQNQFYQYQLNNLAFTSQPTQRLNKNVINSNIIQQNQRRSIFKDKRLYQSIDYSDKHKNQTQNAKSLNNSRERLMQKGIILTDKQRSKIKKLGGIKSKEIIKEVELFVQLQYVKRPQYERYFQKLKWNEQEVQVDRQTDKLKQIQLKSIKFKWIL